MKKSSFQFHALPEEVISWVNSVADGIHIAKISLWPSFLVEEVSWPINNEGAVERLVLGLVEFNTSAESLPSFAEKNPDCLYVQLPRSKSGELIEGNIGYVVSGSLDVAKTWDQLINKFKRGLRTGAVAVSPVTGAKGPLKAHRFTDGALGLQQAGIVMKPSAGNAVVRLGEVE